MAINNDKLRLLRIMQILWEETDEQHPLSATGVLKLLSARYDMSADRKTIYSDIELLNEMDIVHTPHKNGGFYIGTRNFELAELKLMVDAVMIPIGGYYTIDIPQAVKVIDQIKPKMILPMHYMSNEKTGVEFGYEVLDTVTDFLEYFDTVVTLEESMVDTLNIPAKVVVLKPQNI